MTYIDRLTGKEKCFHVGQKVVYIGSLEGVVMDAETVRFEDGSTVKSLATQTHKFEPVNKPPKSFFRMLGIWFDAMKLKA